jgi:DNA polymerase elongation subunit (family B)
MSKPRILHLDIETSPNTAYVWGLFKETIPLARLISAGRTLCFAAKWHGEKEIMFGSEWTHGRDEMLRMIWELLDEADIVCHYNGRRFDIPTLNKEFVLEDITPPSPYRQIDLLQVVRREFRFTSNKLDYVSQQLGLGAKTQHKGMELWTGVLNHEKSAQRVMEKYNKQDVRLLERLYYNLLPWLGRTLNLGVYGDDHPACSKCGSHNIQHRGYQYTNAGKYRRYKCNSCGGWSREIKNLLDLDTRRQLARPA